ncbi:uncharacterized protein LOC132721219 [Ruditapes philippinarum]|uniref:uncharacterized protein LOC132721219 n=1 Tax=Ruditapes philippinarum TaxID=129788 RepID=UPI00295A7C68|nr:uncharacterized protein LOC132721219 [Ruditapes philippinarum]
MQILIYVFASFLFFNHAYGESQQMIYSATYSGTTITFDIRIYTGTDTVAAAAIANPTTGIIDSGTSTNACKYIASSSPVPLVSGTQGSNNYVEFEVVIDFTDLSSVTFESVGNTDLGCTFSVSVFTYHIICVGKSKM